MQILDMLEYDSLDISYTTAQQPPFHAQNPLIRLIKSLPAFPNSQLTRSWREISNGRRKRSRDFLLRRRQRPLQIQRDGVFQRGEQIIGVR
jgi:hypothetical protein